MHARIIYNYIIFIGELLTSTADLRLDNLDLIVPSAVAPFRDRMCPHGNEAD